MLVVHELCAGHVWRQWVFCTTDWHNAALVKTSLMMRSSDYYLSSSPSLGHMLFSLVDPGY